MNKYASRQKLLAALIQDQFDGVLARFASAVDIAPSYVSRMLYPEGKAGAKRIGENTIEKIESSLNMKGYFSGSIRREHVGKTMLPAKDDDYITIQHLDTIQDDLDISYENTKRPETINEIRFSSQFLRGLLGSYSKTERLVLIDGRGDSMLPTIQHGDTLLVDTGINRYDHDGLYLLNLGHGIQVKRLVDRGEDLYVCSDNPIYQPFPLPESADIIGRAHLVNKLILLN